MEHHNFIIKIIIKSSFDNFVILSNIYNHSIKNMQFANVLTLFKLNLQNNKYQVEYASIMHLSCNLIVDYSNNLGSTWPKNSNPS